MGPQKILVQATVPTTIGTILAVTGAQLPTITGFILVNHTAAAIMVGAGIAGGGVADATKHLFLPQGFSLPAYGTQEFLLMGGEGVELSAADLFRAVAGASGVTIQIIGRY